MRATIGLVCAALAAATVAPADALADKTFKGKSAQKRTVTLTTTDGNVLRFARIGWLTRRCSLSGARFQNRTTFRPPFDAATPGAFRDAGSFTVADRGGYRSRVTLTFTGGFDAAASAWRGSIEGTVVVRRRGRVIDRCTLRRTYWTVNRTG
jgi:hypothetical protein